MIHPCDQYGPWMPGLDQAEFRARCRSLQAITRLCTGPRGADLANLLRRAEGDAAALEQALAALDRLPSKDRRHVLTSFAALHRPAAGAQ